MFTGQLLVASGIIIPLILFQIFVYKSINNFASLTNKDPQKRLKYSKMNATDVKSTLIWAFGLLFVLVIGHVIITLITGAWLYIVITGSLITMLAILYITVIFLINVFSVVVFSRIATGVNVDFEFDENGSLKKHNTLLSIAKYLNIFTLIFTIATPVILSLTNDNPLLSSLWLFAVILLNGSLIYITYTGHNVLLKGQKGVIQNFTVKEARQQTGLKLGELEKSLRGNQDPKVTRKEATPTNDNKDVEAEEVSGEITDK